MNENAAHQQQDHSGATPPPIPPMSPTPAFKDRIDPESPDAKSVAPSDGTGVSGKVEPPQDEPSWMQDA